MNIEKRSDNNTERGRMIVFEGLDYSFKETNTKRLVEYIQNNITDKVILLSFPNYTSYSSIFVKKYLEGVYGDPSELDPYQSSFFYSMDRYDTIKTKNIDKLLEEGYYVIVDRYSGSNKIFQSTKIEPSKVSLFLDYLNDLEYNKLQLPKEDITIFMNMPVDVSFPLIQKRKQKAGKDLIEENEKFMRKVESSALYVAHLSYWNIVNCTKLDTVYGDYYIKSQNEIFREILYILKSNKII